MGVEVSPTGSRSASEDNRPATRSAIAKTGAMLLNGQERASASKSAVAAARGPGEHAIWSTRHQVSGSSDADELACFAVNRRVAGSRNYAGRDMRGSWLLGSLGCVTSKKERNDADHDPSP